MTTRWIATSLMLLAMTFLPATATALTVDAKLPDATQEVRAQALFHTLRCVVCQSESVADSPAEVARDMRRAVREEIAAGKSDEAITDEMVSRYGERVLMMPERNARNAPLWIAPLLLLLAGALAAWKIAFRKETP